jgi:hypothetical protein
MLPSEKAFCEKTADRLAMEDFRRESAAKAGEALRGDNEKSK